MFECVLLPEREEGSSAKSTSASGKPSVDKHAQKNIHRDLNIKDEDSDYPNQIVGETSKLTDVLDVDPAENGTWDMRASTSSSHESSSLHASYNKAHSSNIHQQASSHIKHDETVQNRFICQVCSEIYHSVSDLQSHVEKEHRTLRRRRLGFTCLVCKAILSSNFALNKHMATVHKPSNEGTVIQRPRRKCQEEPKNMGLDMTCMNDEDAEKLFLKNKNKSKYACKICDVKMSSKTKIMAHMFTAHCNEVSSESDTEDKFFVCFLCNTQFSTQIELNSHEHKKCTQCDLYFLTSELETHMIDMHNMKKQKKATPVKQTKEDSIEKETEESVDTVESDDQKESENNQDEDTFVQGDTYWEDQSSDNESTHSNIKIDEPRVETWKRVIIDNFVCNYCFRNFRTKMALYDHGENEHNDKNFQPIVKSKSRGEGAYKCDKCKATFNYLPPLIDHKLKHRGILPYACKYCRKIYATKRNLIFHCNRFHSSKLEEELQRGALSKRHSANENDELPPYDPDKLEDFDYIKVTQEDLNNKRQVIIVCSICKTRVKTLLLLYKHCVQFHSDHIVMPKVRKQIPGHIKCKMCDYTFSKIEYMRQHLIRHFDVRPYMCKYCGKIYADRRGLSTHKQQLHNNESFLEKHKKPSCNTLELGSSHFTCDTCGQDFMKLIHLKRHIKFAHTLFADTEYPASTSTTEITKIEQDIKIESYNLNNFYPENGNDNLVCNFCNSSFNSKRLFIEHCQKTHGLLGSLPNRSGTFNHLNCTRCERTFTSNRQLSDHLMIHDGIRPYSCSTCKKSYLGKAGLEQHCRKVHGNKKKKAKKIKKRKKVKESESDTESSSNEQVQNICETILKEDTSQEQQFLNFDQNPSDKYQITEEKIEKTFTCLHCGIVKDKKCKLIVHMMAHFHCKFRCKNCPHKFKTVRKWKSHMCDIMKYPFLCTYCGFRFKTKPKLLVHKSKHEKTVVCDECGKAFHNTTARNRHKACYHDAPQHLCPECGAVFGLACQLDRHLRNHKEMKHACDSCPRKFWDHRQLQHHRNMEHKEKRFICELCGRALSQKWHYDFHMERHAGIRKYGCEECNKSYTSTNALKYHNRTRHPERVKNKM